MREIRFRAINKKTKETCEVFLISFVNGYVEVLPDCELEGGTTQYWMFDDIDLIQYTGKKDINGIDIFEGDIVERTTRQFDFDKDEDNDSFEVTERSFIEYRGYGFWVNDESFGWEGENLWNWEKVKVIGNIHVNPELLNNG